MTKERRAQVHARIQEMSCARASPPLDLFVTGWGPNEDGTQTFWCVGPGMTVAEGVTLRAEVEPSDFEQLREFLKEIQEKVAC